MYGREYSNKILSFEASGALKNATLVMRDRETDSWWSIMSGDAIGGALAGEKLKEVPVGEKVRWGEWKTRHPESLVLSVDGAEHDPDNPYQRYLGADDTYRNVEVKDDRLPGKEPIYSFRLDGTAYAVPHKAVVGGAAFMAGGSWLFVYRAEGADLMASSEAYVVLPGALAGSARADAGPFQQVDGVWTDVRSGVAFVPGVGFPAEAGADVEQPQRLGGFDTFWYSWSNTNNDVVILK